MEGRKWILGFGIARVYRQVRETDAWAWEPSSGRTCIGIVEALVLQDALNPKP